jgi:zinc transport system substrate-binding protein
MLLILYEASRIRPGRALGFRWWVTRLLISLIGLVTTGHAEDSGSGSTQPLKVVTSIQPLYWLAQDLVAELSDVTLTSLMPRNATPHDFGLTPQLALRLRQADLVLWLGADAEPYLKMAIQQAEGQVLSLLNLQGVVQRYPDPAQYGLHSHEHDHSAHSAEGLDPHLWWHGDNLILLGEALVDRLTQMRPDQAASLRTRLADWRRGIEVQRMEFRQRYQGASLGALGYHDAFGYLLMDLGLQADAVLMRSPELTPGARRLLELRQMVSSGELRCVILEPAAKLSWITKIDPEQRLARITLDPMAWDVKASGERVKTQLGFAYQQLSACLRDNP